MKYPMLAASVLLASPLHAQTGEIDQLRSDLAKARAQIDAQDSRLRALEARLVPTSATAPARVQEIDPTTNPPTVTTAPVIAPAPVTAQATPVESVGVAPAKADRPPEVAVLGDQGSIVTRRGQLTAEFQADYSRSDRDRAFFRGVSAAEVLLIGVFDINQTRQDVLTASGALRYGVTNKLEIGVRVPYVRRNDAEILAPVQSGSANTNASTIDSSARGSSIGDVEITARYQLTSARGGWPFLIANLQATAPTGSDPFRVPRNTDGTQQVSATGAGFWSVSPSITAILPSDPAVLFGSIGYSKNFGRNENTQIGDIDILRANPGDALSFSAGIGVALNQRTTLNLGYAHTWVFSTYTLQSSPGRDANNNPTTILQGAHTRDLQLGRLLFGVSYRATDRATINWSVEAGATRDATDLRTVLRVPLTLFTGH
ncbi:MAG: hypothetical protein ACRYG4_17600 [Janthinobacterium lividum]